jgi:hypothetical protein
VDADIEATASDLAVLDSAGDVVREPAGRDALWRQKAGIEGAAAA